MIAAEHGGIAVKERAATSPSLITASRFPPGIIFLLGKDAADLWSQSNGLEKLRRHQRSRKFVPAHGLDAAKIERLFRVRNASASKTVFSRFQSRKLGHETEISAGWRPIRSG